MFLFSATVGAVMIYGMVLLFGMTGTLRLPELAAKLPAMPVVTALAALFLVLAGHGFEVTLVPFHTWVPDTYQGAPTPIAGFLSVGPKAAGLAGVVRTPGGGFPPNPSDSGGNFWGVCGVYLTGGEKFFLRQTKPRR